VSESTVIPLNPLQVGRNATFLLAAQVLYSLCNVVAMVLLGNTLAAEGYGEYAFYYALIPLIAGVADAGVGITVTREIARDNASGPRLLGDGLLIKGMISGLILLVSVAGAWAMLDPAHATLVSLVVAAALMDPAQDPAIWVFRAHGLLHFEALMLLLSQAVWLPLLLLATVSKAGLPGLLGAAGVAFAVRLTLGAVIVVRRLYWPEFRPARERLRGFMAAGLPFGAAMLVKVLYGYVGILMLKGLATSADVGYFNVAFMLSQPLTFIASVLGITAFPAFARDARGGGQVLRRDLTQNFKWQVLLSVPLMVGLFLLARPTVSFLLRGPDFHPAARGLALTSLGMVIFFLNISYRYVLAALDLQRRYFHAIVAGLVTNVVLCAVLIPLFGYLGACAAFLGAEATILMVGHRALSKHVRLRELLIETLKPLAAGVGMGLLVLTLHESHVFVRVAVGCITYPALLFLLQTFTVEEKGILYRLHLSFRLPGAALLWRTESHPLLGLHRLSRRGATGTAEGELQSRIQAEMPAWYPGIPYRSARLVHTRDFVWSRHLIYRLATADDREATVIMVKQPRTNNLQYLPQDEMRASVQSLEKEYQALTLIYAQLGDEHVNGITAVRPLAWFSDLEALVMQYRPGTDFHSIITRATRSWARRETAEAATAMACTAGRLLALLHNLRRDPYPRAEVFQWGAFANAVSESLAQLAETTSSPEIGKRLLSMQESLASLADRAPRTNVTYLHGDLYPDNLVLVPEGRLYTIDTTSSHLGAVEADIAKFLVGVDTLKPRLLLGRAGVRVTVLKRVQAAFLQGYSSEGSYSPDVLKLHCIHALARRWQEASRVLKSDVPRVVADLIWRSRIEPELTACLLESPVPHREGT